jgi:hypothetical protein
MCTYSSPAKAGAQSGDSCDGRFARFLLFPNWTPALAGEAEMKAAGK